MLKPEFAKKKYLRLKFIKVGIGNPPAQTPMSEFDTFNSANITPTEHPVEVK